MAENFATRLYRWYFNFFPAYRGAGGRVTYIAGDWKEIRVRLPLSWRTRNYVGVIFGGSLYAVTDPVYMIMLIKLLGPEYVVWDKAASIQFKKPGRATLYGTFRVSDAELEHIRTALQSQHSIDCQYEVQLVDRQGVMHACIEKTIYIRKKNPAPV